MSESLLLTDTEDPSVAEAISRLDGWRLERLPAEPPADISEFAGVRLVLLYEQNPSAGTFKVDADPAFTTKPKVHATK